MSRPSAMPESLSGSPSLVSQLGQANGDQVDQALSSAPATGTLSGASCGFMW